MTEIESKFDEMERDRLQAVVSALETALAVSSPASRSVVERGLQGAKGRMEFLNQKIKDAQVERENLAREQAALVATLAERETRLNSEEKRTYAGFLEKSFFTKSDFSALESFYGKSWDRLSDSGKNEMSHRVWEGIRKGQYTFKGLPAKVREKETEWAYENLVKREHSPACTGDIPKRDRDDFIRAYEGGRKEECQEILGRESFKQNMFRGAESKGVKQASVEIGREELGKTTGLTIATARPVEQQPAKTERDSVSDLSDLSLDGVKLADSPQRISSSDIPNGKPQNGTGTPSLGG
jgi:hypothetical protein